MIFGLVLMCLDADVDNCKLLHDETRKFETIQECRDNVKDVAQKMDDYFLRASPKDMMCVRLSNKPAA